MLILNPVPDFKNFGPKLPFWGIFGPKIKSDLFFMKIGTQPNLGLLILNSVPDFRDFEPKLCFWANLVQKLKVLSFP